MYVLALLITVNMLLFNHSLIAITFFKAYRFFIKPKFKVGDFVIIRGIIFEVIHVSSRASPYSYYCLPLNKSQYTLGNYYKQTELKPLPELTKTLL